MIVSINIKNLALIDNMNVSFGKGLNIITGDTGSGKTIILKAISAIFGYELDKDLITHGKEEMTIDAEIVVDDKKKEKIFNISGIATKTDTYVISRSFLLNGRNSNRLNGRIISVDTLNEIGEILFDIHNQDETRNLLRKDKQIELLDEFCDKEFYDVIEKYSIKLKLYNKKINLLNKMKSQDKDIEMRKDILEYQIKDIESTEIKEGEYKELNERKKILANAEMITESLSKANSILTGEDISNEGAVDKIKEVSNLLAGISKFNSKYDEYVQVLEKSYWELKDIEDKLLKEVLNEDFSSSDLDGVIARIDEIDRIRKKYGNDYYEIEEYLSKCKQELNSLNNSEEEIKIINKEISVIESDLEKLDRIIQEYRQKAALVVEKRVKKELKDLDMDKLSFEIKFKKKKSDKSYNENGNHEVVFLISPNPGHPVKPLEKISSGGEMARVMVAFKKLIANIDNTSVIVFDEIESGVSGSVAFKVGEKIKHISKYHQVICVTHTPQLAAFSDNHYYVSKKKNNNNTVSKIEKLNDESKVKYIAKLLGSNKITNNTINNAKDLLLNANKSDL